MRTRFRNDGNVPTRFAGVDYAALTGKFAQAVCPSCFSKCDEFELFLVSSQ